MIDFVCKNYKKEEIRFKFLTIRLKKTEFYIKLLKKLKFVGIINNRYFV